MKEESDSSVLDFLARYLADREAGEPEPLEAYLALYPGREEQIRRVHAELDAAAPRTTRPDPPDRIAHYRLIEELGRGGQGVVWLAEDERLGRRVALKLIRRSPMLDDLTPRLRREAQSASRLDHPGLCPVYDVGVDGGAAYIAMRYVPGRTLAARLASEEPPAPVDQVLEELEEAARAMHVAHEAGIVHRDVKPANLMISPDGSVVVLDFGIALEEEDGAPLTLTGDALGTPAYMAPEQLAGGRADRRADVWALGVTLYEALTGARPFEGATREALVRAVLESEPDPPRRSGRPLPRDVRVVLATALAKERDRRYQSALALAQDLACLRARQPILARPIGPLARARRWCQRNPALAGSLGALLVALAGGLVVSLILLGGARRALDAKDVALDQVNRLADQKLARDLLAEEHTLYPTVPERLNDFAAWIGHARDLVERASLHRSTLAALGDRAQAGVRFPAVGSPAATDAWMRTQLEQLLDDLDRLAEAIPRVERRRDFAAEVERRTIEEPRAAWDAAAARVAADPRFSGLVLAPQRGLVPLGADPGSGLEEFAHLETGVVPTRDPAHGALLLDESSAVVLVLVPGGVVHVGAERPPPEGEAAPFHVDPAAGQWDGPVQEVRLDPYMISKYELTQGQWLRHTDVNPSTYQYEVSSWVDAERPLLHPVEQVSWDEAARVLGELGLCLPSEARWEAAARARTRAPWSTGEDPRDLEGYANLGDATAYEIEPSDSWSYERWLRDGYVVHAPVGSFQPNEFGLHDTMGNVEEWCQDTWEDWRENPPRDGDGLTQGKILMRVTRGGYFGRGALRARLSGRSGMPPEASGAHQGVRPAYELAGE